MPLQRRLPKVGFRSHLKKFTAEVRLHELAALGVDVVDLLTLKSANIIPSHARSASIIDSGALEVAVHVKGIRVTKGALEKIIAAGGKVEV